MKALGFALILLMVATVACAETTSQLPDVDGEFLDSEEFALGGYGGDGDGDGDGDEDDPLDDLFGCDPVPEASGRNPNRLENGRLIESGWSEGGESRVEWTVISYFEEIAPQLFRSPTENYVACGAKSYYRTVTKSFVQGDDCNWTPDETSTTTDEWGYKFNVGVNPVRSSVPMSYSYAEQELEGTFQAFDHETGVAVQDDTHDVSFTYENLQEDTLPTYEFYNKDDSETFGGGGWTPSNYRTIETIVHDGTCFAYREIYDGPNQYIEEPVCSLFPIYDPDGEEEEIGDGFEVLDISRPTLGSDVCNLSLVRQKAAQEGVPLPRPSGGSV